MTSKEQRRHEWTVRIADYKASGLTMSAWCTTQHFSLHKLKYWIRQLKDDSPSAVTTSPARWVPLSVTDQSLAISASSLVVRVGQASIELRADFDPHLLRKIVQALEIPC
jgi:hypothetical protein